jgi:diguanylate cyclase (GGDEF)-like protein
MPRSVLVVEDEALIAYDIESVLVGFGYRVPAMASNTEEALRAVTAFRPDLVLLDMRLKGGDDGVATAAAIRMCRPTPIVFLSSHSDDATIARAREVEPYGYLLKPFNDRELLATLEMAWQRHLREQALVRQGGVLADVVNGVQEAILAVDRDGRVLFANDAALRAVGETGASDRSSWTVGGDCICLADGKTPCPPDALPLARALQGESVRNVELSVRPPALAEGRLYSVNATPLFGLDGDITGAVAVGRDVTDGRVSESSLRVLAHTDELTGAYNRRGFMEAACEKFTAMTNAGRTPAVFFIDLNGMKRINDTLGHSQGDRAIEDTVEVLRSTFRTSDIIARLGGDEFVVFAQDAGGNVEALQDRLAAAVAQFNETGGRDYRLSLSVGVAEYDPSEQHSLESLVAQADRRMYEAKTLRSEGRIARAVPSDLPEEAAEREGAHGLGDEAPLAQNDR